MRSGLRLYVENMTKKKIAMIIIITILSIACLHIVDQYFAITYFSKTLVKILLFLVLPFIYVIWSKDNFISNVFKKPLISYKKTMFFLNMAVFFGIVGIFFLIKDQLNVSTIIKELEEKYQVTSSNLIFYGTYIIIVNSFIEEFFFRGFIFLNLKNLNQRFLAYAVSSVSFAIYHIAIFKNWFSISVFLLALFGLITGGLIFDFFDDKPNSFINSWLIHVSADAAIIIIGFYLFLTS